jgi:hypothetical protein
MDRQEYSARLKFEHELINRRVTWLLTSQSILFAAYGVALKASAVWFLKTVAFTGGFICALIFIGISAAFCAKYYTWQDFKNSGNPAEPFWVRTVITYVAFIPEFALPLLFIRAWATLYCKAG